MTLTDKKQICNDSRFIFLLVVLGIGVNIKYIFGNFPNMLWNGGSIMVNNMRIFTPQIIEIKEWYEELNIPLQLTLTNTSLSEKHLSNRF